VKHRFLLLFTSTVGKGTSSMTTRVVQAWYGTTLLPPEFR
jgi:hypothetical protein